MHAAGWGEGPWALVTPVKAKMVWVGILKNDDCSELGTKLSSIVMQTFCETAKMQKFR